MEQMIGQFASLGAVGIIAYVLFKNTLDEKKEDRLIYKQSVETFTETSRQFADSIHALSMRLENVEGGNERIEQKLDNFINSKGE